MKEQGSWCGETHIQKCSYFLQEMMAVVALINRIANEKRIRCGALLREAGSGPVHPFVLATAAGGGDLE